MAMFKKFKSLFVEEIEEAQKASAAKTESMPKAKSKPSQRATAPTSSGETAAPHTGQVTDKFMKILFGAMDKANLDGFDYLEFKNSLNSLKKMQQMDEATRFQSAFAMAQTMGATPQNLTQTAQHYLNILEKEEKKFEQALDGNMQKQIGSKQQEMKALAAQINEKEKMIKQMTAEIEASKKKHQKVLNDVKKASNKIEVTKSDFIASYEAIRAQIVRDMEHIKQYLS